MSKKKYLLDIDGVLVRGRRPIPGAQEFIARLVETRTPFLVLTNNPLYTPRDLSHRLASEGLEPADTRATIGSFNRNRLRPNPDCRRMMLCGRHVCW
jgi:ribonucleotide monophosphatase NagD (HAD superfamily)